MTLGRPIIAMHNLFECCQLFRNIMSNFVAQLMEKLVHISGRTFEGIWHTSIVVFGKEYFFGNSGIEMCEPVRDLITNSQSV